jgi:glutamate--cysteine ligase catalytic subunit
MFEMTPNKPYSTQYNLDEIIRQIRYKYSMLQTKKIIPLTIPCIPFMGVRDPKTEKTFVNTITQSQYISDDHIAPHPRFPTLTKNIRLRRKHTVDIRVPLFIDENTNIEEIRETNEPYDGFIYLDAMCFGMGLCCLQCTFSTKNVDHARYIYDQLNVLSPIFLALTAGTPFIKGKVSDWDVRWNIISGSVDDRP